MSDPQTLLAPEPTPEPPPLTDEYHRARRNLNLASAFLFGWEFIGFELAQPHADIGGLVLTVKTPEAVPWVITSLVIFFGVRFRIEWQQCAPTRRLVPAARTDVSVSWYLALISLAVLAYQHVSKSQLFTDKAVFHGTLVGLFAALAVSALNTLVRGLWNKDLRARDPELSWVTTLFGCAAYSLVMLQQPRPIAWKAATTSFLLLRFVAFSFAEARKEEARKSAHSA